MYCRTSIRNELKQIKMDELDWPAWWWEHVVDVPGVEVWRRSWGEPGVMLSPHPHHTHGCLLHFPPEVPPHHNGPAMLSIHGALILTTDNYTTSYTGIPHSVKTLDPNPFFPHIPHPLSILSNLKSLHLHLHYHHPHHNHPFPSSPSPTSPPCWTI